jgi:predicted DNA-binding protein (MmcQ/YjbR family)
MPHPIMFGEDDLGLADVRRIALGFPEAVEKISHGRPVFCVPKMFAVYGGSSKRTGEIVGYPYSVLLKVDESERRALEQDRRFFYPMYLGPFGWLGLDLTTGTVDWDEVAELLDASYRLTASKRLIKRLDAP